MQKASIKCRSLRHMANRPPKRSTTFPRSPARKIVRPPCSPKKARRTAIAAQLETKRKPWRRDRTMESKPLGPGRLGGIAGHHAFENLATNLGTSRRGINRCAKTLNLLKAPG